MQKLLYPQPRWPALQAIITSSAELFQRLLPGRALSTEHWPVSTEQLGDIAVFVLVVDISWCFHTQCGQALISRVNTPISWQWDLPVPAPYLTTSPVKIFWSRGIIMITPLMILQINHNKQEISHLLGYNMCSIKYIFVEIPFWLKEERIVFFGCVRIS